jgi:hypothetical protein
MTDNFFLRDVAIAHRSRMAESLSHRNVEREAQEEVGLFGRSREARDKLRPPAPIR